MKIENFRGKEAEYSDEEESDTEEYKENRHKVKENNKEINRTKCKNLQFWLFSNSASGQPCDWLRGEARPEPS